MQTFNQSLATLYHRRLISLQTALGYSSHQDELQDMINRGVGAVSQAETHAASRRT
jgi:twitching motility protein PilT